jgi:hypothetical protein
MLSDLARIWNQPTLTVTVLTCPVSRHNINMSIAKFHKRSFSSFEIIIYGQTDTRGEAINILFQFFVPNAPT